MLDIKLIREKPKEVKKNTKLRAPDKVGLVDDILKHDEEYRKLLKRKRWKWLKYWERR